MNKLFLSLVLSVSFTNPSETITNQSAAPIIAPVVDTTPSYKLYIADNVPAWMKPIIIKAVANATPAHLDSILVKVGDNCCGLGKNEFDGNRSTISIAPGISNSNVLIHVLGHELGHADEDVNNLSQYQQELAADAWGIMTVIDLGGNPRDVVDYYRKRNLPEGSKHPSDSYRADAMEKIIANYKK